MKRPLRVLHVVGAMNRGGVETWLLNVLRRLPRDEVALDVMIHTNQPAAYDDEVEALGATIHRNAHTGNPARYARDLYRILATAPSYDVIHSHVHHYSGIVLATAMLAGVPVRIAHSHSDTRPADVQSSRSRRLYLSLTSGLIRRCATVGFACSGPAAASLFGDRWLDDPRWRVLYCGVDVTAYSSMPDRNGVRREFGLPSDAKIVIHVGRFDENKNHAFLVDVFAALLRHSPKVYLLMVGSGATRPMVDARVRAFGLQDRVRFCGARSDVARLLRAADVFVFPSLYEGLPLACLEAQAAGLPLAVSDSISKEVIVDPASVVRLQLGAVDRWVEAIQRALRRRPAGTALAALKDSPFDVSASASALAEAYRLAVLTSSRPLHRRAGFVSPW